jgi:uncharacterized protein YcfJ
MRRMLFAAGLTLAIATASTAEARSGCEAYAHNRRVTGTALGALGGGLLGGAVAGHGSKTEGAVLGAVAGGVVGNQLSRTSCDYTIHGSHASTRSRTRTAPAANQDAAAGTTGACRYENRPYYDQTGRMIYAPTQVCD